MVRIVHLAVLLTYSCVPPAANTDISRRMFVENRLYPDGPSAYLMEHYDDKINVLGNASYVVANFLADALLVRVSSPCPAPGLIFFLAIPLLCRLGQEMVDRYHPRLRLHRIYK